MSGKNGGCEKIGGILCDNTLGFLRLNHCFYCFLRNSRFYKKYLRFIKKWCGKHGFFRWKLHISDEFKESYSFLSSFFLDYFFLDEDGVITIKIIVIIKKNAFSIYIASKNFADFFNLFITPLNIHFKIFYLFFFFIRISFIFWNI